MRRYRCALEALIALALTAALPCAVFAEDPGDWAFRHRDKFIEEYLRIPADATSGSYFSVLIFGDYQCETRLSLWQAEGLTLAASIVAKSQNVQKQLASARAGDKSGEEESIFPRVSLAHQRSTSAEIPALSAIWDEISTLKLPVISKAGFMSPAVWYDVTTFGGSVQHFSFPRPAPGVPSVGYLETPQDHGYQELSSWTRKVLEALGGDAAAAATGGDCGLNRVEPGGRDHNTKP